MAEVVSVSSPERCEIRRCARRPDRRTPRAAAPDPRGRCRLAPARQPRPGSARPGCPPRELPGATRSKAGESLKACEKSRPAPRPVKRSSQSPTVHRVTAIRPGSRVLRSRLRRVHPAEVRARYTSRAATRLNLSMHTSAGSMGPDRSSLRSDPAGIGSNARLCSRSKVVVGRELPAPDPRLAEDLHVDHLDSKIATSRAGRSAGMGRSAVRVGLVIVGRRSRTGGQTRRGPDGPAEPWLPPGPSQTGPAVQSSPEASPRTGRLPRSIPGRMPVANKAHLVVLSPDGTTTRHRAGEADDTHSPPAERPRAATPRTCVRDGRSSRITSSTHRAGCGRAGEEPGR